MLEHLIPVSQKHSIGKVTATIFLPQKMIKPESIFNKLNEEPQYKFNYQKRNLTHIHTFDINSKNSTLNKQTKDKTGFIFENFDERGRLRNIFRLHNQNDNQAILSFETRNYSTWENFFKEMFSDVDLFSKNFPFYISAISLNYNDSFTWVSEPPIPVNEIFNIDSELISTKFLKSDNGTTTLLSQSLDANTGYEEMTEISFSNTVKKVIINHNYVKRFDNLEFSPEMLHNGLFQNSYNSAHQINKDILKDILSVEIQQRIGLI